MTSTSPRKIERVTCEGIEAIGSGASRVGGGSGEEVRDVTDIGPVEPLKEEKIDEKKPAFVGILEIG